MHAISCLQDMQAIARVSAAAQAHEAVRAAIFGAKAVQALPQRIFALELLMRVVAAKTAHAIPVKVHKWISVRQDAFGAAPQRLHAGAVELNRKCRAVTAASGGCALRTGCLRLARNWRLLKNLEVKAQPQIVARRHMLNGAGVRLKGLRCRQKLF